MLDYEAALADLDAEIFELYRGGSVDQVLLGQLWHEFDKLIAARNLADQGYAPDSEG